MYILHYVEFGDATKIIFSMLKSPLVLTTEVAVSINVLKPFSTFYTGLY